MIFAVVEDNGRIFDAFDVASIVFCADQWTAGAPLEGALYIGRSLCWGSYAEWWQDRHKGRQGKK
jgi:hypothetical protein